MLSFIAPSFLVNGMPSIFRFEVIPRTTMFPLSSNKTKAGLFLISKVSVYWTSDNITSPNLCIVPILVLYIIPKFFHLFLLNFMKKLIILIFFLHFSKNMGHFFQKFIICLPRIFSSSFQKTNYSLFQ